MPHPDLRNVTRTRILRLALLLLLPCLAGCPGPGGGGSGTGQELTEEVARFNILGTAYLGQQKWAEAETEFRHALELRGKDPLLLNNTATALVQQGRIDEARTLLVEALTHDAEHPWAHYNLGLIEKNDGRFEEATGHFESVAGVDPDDLLTQYNLAVVLSRVGRDAEAEAAFRRALELDPTHVSSLYGLGRFLLQKGDQAEGERLIGLSQEIRSRSGLDEAVGSMYGEQGPYAMGADYPGDALLPPEPIPVSFTAGSTSALGLGARQVWTLTRLNGESALIVGDGERLHRVVDEGSEPLTPPLAGETIRVLTAGDIDNDGTVELAVMSLGNEGLSTRLARAVEGVWSWDSPLDSVRLQADFDRADIAFVDLDHDGDLDLFWCWKESAESMGAAGCRIGTNDGAGHFSTADTLEHGFEFKNIRPGSMRVGFSDFDNDRDIDLFVAQPQGFHILSNQRDGTFEDRTRQSSRTVGTVRAHAMLVEDANKDGWMDVLIGGPDGVDLHVSRRGTLAPVDRIIEGWFTSLVSVDYDNDGFRDLVTSTNRGAGPQAYRNAGGGAWELADGVLDPEALGKETQVVAAFDHDQDGDLDLAAFESSRGWTLLTNQGGNANGWIAVDAKGIGDNRFGVGTKIEILAGALRQKFEITGPLPLHAGLGKRKLAESVRFLWPTGVLQDEINQPAGGRVELTELDRKGTSCPLLYAWRDGRWNFVTDFLGGSAIGYLHAPGVYGVPDTDEYVRIDEGLTEDAQGRLRLRVNNQLEEVIWFDETELIVVDHPAGTEVYPNERLMPGPPYPEFELFVSDDIRPVEEARGIDRGDDLTATLRESDRNFVDNFDNLPYKGYAERHTIELNLGRFDNQKQSVLLLDGWIDYADSTSNLAAYQAGAELIPPRLYLADGWGRWIRTDHVMGFPAGLPKTMAVNLTGLFPTADHRIRIETNMRIYWDQARVLLGGDPSRLRVQRLRPESAELRFGGFPRPTSVDGLAPFSYDPSDVAPSGGWKSHVGAYTAFGDVTELLLETDDRLVATRNGDEVELSFIAPAPPQRGWSRTYLLFADGFGKDMDMNSATPNTVGPRPFHGMTEYPYGTEVHSPVAAEPGPRRHVRPSDHGWHGAPPLARPDAR